MSFYPQTGKQASRQHKQGRQEERQAALPLHSCFRSLISHYCCSVGIFFFFLPLLLKQQQSPATYSQPPFFVLFLSPLAKGRILRNPRLLPSVWVGDLLGAPSEVERGSPAISQSPLLHHRPYPHHHWSWTPPQQPHESQMEAPGTGGGHRLGSLRVGICSRGRQTCPVKGCWARQGKEKARTSLARTGVAVRMGVSSWGVSLLQRGWAWRRGCWQWLR